jgi:hypothetical protein
MSCGLNPEAHLVTGVICGDRVEEIENPLRRKVRRLDRLVDELAGGKKMEKILRAGENGGSTGRRCTIRRPPRHPGRAWRRTKPNRGTTCE